MIRVSGNWWHSILMRRQLQWCAVTMAWLCLSAAGVVHGQCRYEVTAIIEGPSCGIFGKANLRLLGMNDLGQACGVVFGCAGSDVELPWVWSEETGLVLLELPEGATRGEAVDINNALGSDGLGQVACTLGGLGLDGDKAFLYDDGAWTNLGVLTGDTNSVAESINDSGVIVGHSVNVFTGPQRAVMWSGSRLVDLQLPLEGANYANDVHDNGSIVGRMGQVFDFSRGFRWDEGETFEVPIFPGFLGAQATAVSRDAIIGTATDRTARRGWHFQNGKLTDLGGDEVFNRVSARDINDAGQALVDLQSHPPHINNPEMAFWQHGQLTELVSLVIPVEGLGFGTSFVALNNVGQIGGTAGYSKTGSAVGVILTPVNQPLGDVNIDCVVDERDLIAVLDDWGPDKLGHLTDIVTNSTFQPPGDGVVDGADLAVVLGNWSPASSVRDAITWR